MCPAPRWRAKAAACRHRDGARGFAATTRAGGYGATSMWRQIEAQDAATTVVAQIEDPQALDEIDAIAATPGIDCLFIGCGDLTAAFADPSADAPAVRAAVERNAAAGRKAGKPVCVFVGGLKEVRWLDSLGATAFILGSDHSFMRQAAAAGAAEIRGMTPA
jgi:2-keto-3-deoxy-L-rhamnonate aldolase RhmA